MNEATLERLMMDAALGGLNDDVQELLMAHLAGDERRISEAEQLRALVGKAREAMNEECPAQPDLQIAGRLRREKLVVWGRTIVAMAACVVIGIGIAGLRPQPVPKEKLVVVEKAANPTVVAVNQPRAKADGELWSAQRIYRNAIESSRNEKPDRAARRIFQ